MPVSKYRHVTLRSGPTKRTKPWQAVIGRDYLGCFATEEEAAQAAADKLGQPKKTLLKKPAAETCEAT